MIHTFNKLVKSFFRAVRTLLALFLSCRHADSQTHSHKLCKLRVKTTEFVNFCNVWTAQFGLIRLAVHSANDRDTERSSKLLTEPETTVKHNFFTVHTCMKRPKMNTVSGLSGAVYGSLGVCPRIQKG